MRCSYANAGDAKDIIRISNIKIAGNVGGELEVLPEMRDSV